MTSILVERATSLVCSGRASPRVGSQQYADSDTDWKRIMQERKSVVTEDFDSTATRPTTAASIRESVSPDGRSRDTSKTQKCGPRRGAVVPRLSLRCLPARPWRSIRGRISETKSTSRRASQRPLDAARNVVSGHVHLWRRIGRLEVGITCVLQQRLSVLATTVSVVHPTKSVSTQYIRRVRLQTTNRRHRCPNPLTPTSRPENE